MVTLHRNPAPDTNRPAADVTVTLTGLTCLLLPLPLAPASEAGTEPAAAGGVLAGGLAVPPAGVLPPAELGGLGAEPLDAAGGAAAGGVAPLLLPLLPGVAAGGGLSGSGFEAGFVSGSGFGVCGAGAAGAMRCRALPWRAVVCG